MSRLRGAARRLTLVRTGGAAALRWARAQRRGRWQWALRGSKPRAREHRKKALGFSFLLPDDGPSAETPSMLRSHAGKYLSHS